MVRLNKDYIVEIDASNYTLKRDLHKKVIVVRGDKESEEDQYDIIGYYRNLQHAVKGAIDDMNIRKLSRGMHDLEDAIAIIAKNNESFEKLLKKATKEIEIK